MLTDPNTTPADRLRHLSLEIARAEGDYAMATDEADANMYAREITWLRTQRDRVRNGVPAKADAGTVLRERYDAAVIEFGTMPQAVAFQALQQFRTR
jgi:hypothetical protein